MVLQHERLNPDTYSVEARINILKHWSKSRKTQTETWNNTMEKLMEELEHNNRIGDNHIEHILKTDHVIQTMKLSGPVKILTRREIQLISHTITPISKVPVRNYSEAHDLEILDHIAVTESN
jgi:hypothetical protein